MVCNTFLSPDTVYKMRPQTYHYVKFSVGRVGYTPLGIPCDCIMAIMDHSNTAIPFVITAFPALLTALPSQCHSIHELNACVLCFFSWLCYVSELSNACIICSFYLFVYGCIMKFQCSWVVYHVLIPSLTRLPFILPDLFLVPPFTVLGLLFMVMLTGMLLMVMQYGLSSHAIYLYLAFWLWWMGITSLFPPFVTIWCIMSHVCL